MRSIALAAVGAVLAAGVASGAIRSPSRIVDRTVVCRTAGDGYPDPVRHLTVQASPRLGSQSPNTSVSNGPDGAGGVRADIRTGPYFGSNTGYVAITRFRCSRTTLRVPLASRGLRRGTNPLGDRYACEVPSTILIRVRALFRNPVTLSAAPEAKHLAVANGRIATGFLAVTTVASRAPIAFASVDDETGKSKVFVAPSRCVPS